MIDLHRPTPRDPEGIHGAVWEELAGKAYKAPSDKPFTLVAYEAGLTLRAYVEHLAVGDPVDEMPLFLEPEQAVMVPLETTYVAAFSELPRRWKRVLEAIRSFCMILPSMIVRLLERRTDRSYCRVRGVFGRFHGCRKGKPIVAIGRNEARSPGPNKRQLNGSRVYIID